MTELPALQAVGQATTRRLRSVGIHSRAQLDDVGALQHAYRSVREAYRTRSR